MSKWGERPTWVRHAVYWAIALGIIALTAFDGTTSAVSASSGDVESLAWFVTIGLVLAIMGLVVTLLEWEQVGAARNISRSLVLFTFLLGFVAAVLFYARRWGVHIEACRTVGELETCQDKQVLGLLAWHAANVVPVLDITHSMEWPGHVISSMSWNRMTPNQSLFSSRMTCSVAAATSRT